MRTVSAFSSLGLLLSLLASPMKATPIHPTENNPEVDRLFSSFTGEDRPGAAVGIYYKNELVYAKGYGAARLRDDTMVDESTNFRLASITKQFTAMAIMICAERGLLGLDDTLPSHIEDFPNYGRNIKIRQLLHHTSGLRDYESHIPGGQSEQLKDRDVVGILKGLRSTYFTPGTQYRYSNSGYATLAVIVEEASGQTFAEFLEANIFAPLGMIDTVAYEQGVSEVANRAYGHTWQGRRWSETDQSITSAVLGDGGVYTSAREYFLWDQALYGDTLVSRSMMEQAFTRGKLSNGRSISYGFGWVLDRYRGYERHSHTGSTIGFRSAVHRLPERQLTVFVIANRANASPWNIVEEIVDLYLDDK